MQFTSSWTGAGKRWAQDFHKVEAEEVPNLNNNIVFLCYFQKPDDRPSFAHVLDELAALWNLWTGIKSDNDGFKSNFIYLIYIDSIPSWLSDVFHMLEKLSHLMITKHKTIFDPWTLHFICFTVLNFIPENPHDVHSHSYSCSLQIYSKRALFMWWGGNVIWLIAD